MDGEIGFVSASDGVEILHKVEKADRTEGDIHLMGNPIKHLSLFFRNMGLGYSNNLLSPAILKSLKLLILQKYLVWF